MSRAVFLFALAAWPALADEGEFYLGAGAALEAALLRHPLASASDAKTSAVAALPRTLVGTRYGLTNDFQLGLAFDAAAAPNVVTNDVSIADRLTQLHTGTYAELAVPVSLLWRIDSGFDASAITALDLSPTIALWYATAAVDPSAVSGDGLARRLPLEIDDSIQFGLQARARLAFDLRIFDAVSFQTGLYVAAGWAGAPVLRLGVFIEPAWILAVGPH